MRGIGTRIMGLGLVLALSGGLVLGCGGAKQTDQAAGDQTKSGTPSASSSTRTK